MIELKSWFLLFYKSVRFRSDGGFRLFLFFFTFQKIAFQQSEAAPEKKDDDDFPSITIS